MAKDYIGYEALADSALRSVVKEALKRAEKQGLVGNHHFYLTFKTHDEGVDIPPFLQERYPDEITIVLQNQFWGLKVLEDAFEVSLTFQKVPAALHVPFAALTSFVDPGVSFGLQFRNSSAGQGAPVPATISQDAKAEEKAGANAEPVPPVEKPAPAKSAEEATPQVVSLDKFRKK